MNAWFSCLAGLVTFLALGSLPSADGGDTPKDPSTAFKVTTRKKDDRVEVRADKDSALFAIKSPFGISQADIERLDERWPKAVVVRLHLQGLENFRASNGKVKLEAAASLREGKPQLRLWKDGNEDAPLDEKSPFWINLRILGGDGKPAAEIPLKGGFFELTLPAAFLKDNPKSITLSWIDFYRG